MTKQKRIFVALAALLLVVFSVLPVFAQKTESHSVTVINTVGLNNVHIAINQYDIVNGEKSELSTNPLVLPGQVLERVCEIDNLACNAWIRAKIVFANDAPEVGDDFLTISSDKWLKRGEYYYYTEPVQSEKTVELFNKINIPSKWDNEYANKSISFTVYADAVQEKNFTPDFESDDPWFGTIIEHRIHDNYIVPVENEDKLFQVIYKDGAEGLVKVGDDFFSNWGTLMPGDVEKDKVTVKNEYAFPTTIFFQIETIDNSKLSNKLLLRIYTSKGDIYNGKLNGNIKDEIKLVTLNKGEELKVFYELKVPAELTNEFSLSKAKTKWIFRAYAENMEPSQDATSSTSPNSKQAEPQNVQPDQPSYSPIGSSTIQTGDVVIMVSIGIAMLICSLVVIVVARGGRRNE